MSTLLDTRVWFIIFLLALTAGAYGDDSTYVFCVDPENSSNWHWLDEGQYDIAGQWREFKYKKSVYTGFFVHFIDHLRALRACTRGWYAQPADFAFREWRVFVVADVGPPMLMREFLEDGVKVSRVTSPSEIFKPYSRCHFLVMGRYSSSSSSSCEFSNTIFLPQ